MQKFYIKATRDGGQSGRDASFVYHLGINVHPNPDRKSKFACGEGIHLAKTVALAKFYVPTATEFYVAEAGVILGEDNEKARCASCKLIAKIPKESLSALDGLLKLDGNTLCGRDWLEKNMFRVTWEDIKGQRLVVTKDKKRVTLPFEMKSKDRRTVLKALREL